MKAPADGLVEGADGRTRCFWPGADALYLRYHDNEWGRPVDDDRRLFEKLCLEGFQAGLSWITILRKRENFRAAFAGFRLREGRAVRCARGEALPRRCRHRAPSRQDRIGHQQRQARSGAGRRGGLARRFLLALRAATEEPAEASRPRGACRNAEHAGIDGAVEGAEAARLVFRRADHGLRLHAGDGARQRPPRRLCLRTEVEKTRRAFVRPT